MVGQMYTSNQAMFVEYAKEYVRTDCFRADDVKEMLSMGLRCLGGLGFRLWALGFRVRVEGGGAAGTTRTRRGCCRLASSLADIPHRS
jgi:hypothetical protein